MNELIMPHNVGVKNVLDSMKEVLALYKKVTGNYRPMLDGERYDSEGQSTDTAGVPQRRHSALYPVGWQGALS